MSKKRRINGGKQQTPSGEVTQKKKPKKEDKDGDGEEEVADSAATSPMLSVPTMEDGKYKPFFLL
jgi:hypothetical protein